MNRHAPFTRDDLDELGDLYASADAVISMREVHEGDRRCRAIGVRHDVDNHPDALDTAVEMARWEAENGWRSTYFLLHTARYWRDGRVFAAADTMASLGHEIGLHADAIAESLLHGGDPHRMVEDALGQLRDAGHDVIGVVGHGNPPACHVAEFANDEQFVECARPKNGAPDREIRFGGNRLTLAPRPLADFGLAYESVSLRNYMRAGGVMSTRPNQLYNTDSGGKWFYPWGETVKEFGRVKSDGQLHLLVHPDWWNEAFVLAVAA